MDFSSVLGMYCTRWLALQAIFIIVYRILINKLNKEKTYYENYNKRQTN
jgi:predicted DNA-binding ribbon-helix-helix protein